MVRRGALLHPLAAAALAVGLWLSPGAAKALSCLDESPWSGAAGRSPLIAGGVIPVDAQPWALRECQAEAGSCALVGGVEGGPRESVPAAVSASPCVEDAFQVVRLAPERLLTAGATYEVECSFALHSGYVWGEAQALSVDAAGQRALPPVEVVAVDVDRRYTDGCCGDDVFLEVAAVFDRGAEEAFAEGGVVEVDVDGEVIVIASRVGPWSIPDHRGDLVLTPVSAAGVRGEPITVRRREIGGDVAYVPCSIGPGPRSLALWTLGPILAAGWSARRRRRGGAA